MKCFYGIYSECLNVGGVYSNLLHFLPEMKEKQFPALFDVGSIS